MKASCKHPRWFYPLATTGLLVLTVIGFHFFYFQGKAYPNRELAPPIFQWRNTGRRGSPHRGWSSDTAPAGPRGGIADNSPPAPP